MRSPTAYRVVQAEPASRSRRQPGRIGRAGLTQALGRASQTLGTRATPRGSIAMFRAAALALHSTQPYSGSFMAGHARFHQALPVRTLASFLGSRRFARRRTRQQALPRVPACECEIFTGEQSFAGRAKAGLRPNNSFKPTPLRGVVIISRN